MTLPVKITASTVPIPSPMICLVNTSPMIPDVQKQVHQNNFAIPIAFRPMFQFSDRSTASASAGFGTSFILTIVAAPIPVTTIAKK